MITEVRRIGPSPAIGGLEIVQRLGDEPLSERYRARGILNGCLREFLIRRLRPELAPLPLFRRLFDLEVKLQARMTHRAFVQALPAGAPGFSLAEWVEGITLSDLLTSRAHPISSQRVHAIACSLADALAFLHALTDEDGRGLGLIYGNLSSRSVIGTPRGVKLLGIGLRCVPTLSRVRGWSQSTDQRSLALLISEALLMAGEPPSVSFHSILRRMGSVNPAERYESMAAAAAALQQASSAPASTERQAPREYHVLGRLRGGGMSATYHAIGWNDRGDPVDVVIKQLYPDLYADHRYREMFRLEAAISMRLTHPNLVRARELAKIAGAESIVMDYVNGLDLCDILRCLGCIPWQHAIHIIHQVASALAYTHTLCDDDGNHLGLVHRDVSPSNIMITDRGCVKLLDFGIVKCMAAPSELTDHGELKGKFSYLAPEQLAFSGVDERTDQFALGIVAWEIMAGRRLFSSRLEPIETMLQTRQARAPRLSTVAEVPAWLDEVVAKLLQPDPAHRFRSSRHLVEALRREISSLPPPALNQLVRDTYESRAHDTEPVRISVPR